MQKTPKEIMRKLNDPIHVHYHHGDREPHMTPLAMIDLEQLHAEALALIQRLDRTIVDQEKLAKKIYDQKVEAENKIVKLEDRVKQLETERDAAVKDLKDALACFACEQFCRNGGGCNGGSRCDGYGFKWRGVTKEG